MLSIETFVVCAFLIFVAPTLSGKNEDDTQLEECVQALDSQHSSTRVGDLRQTKIVINQGTKPVNGHQRNVKGDQETELEEHYQTNKELYQQAPTNKQESHGLKTDQPPINAQQESVPPRQKDPTDQQRTNVKRNQQIELEDPLRANVQENKMKLYWQPIYDKQNVDDIKHENQLLINVEEDNFRRHQNYLKEHQTTVEHDHKKVELNKRLPVEAKQNQIIKLDGTGRHIINQLSAKAEENRGKELKQPIQISVSKDCETDHERDAPSMWTLQTREVFSTKIAPLLGLKKRTFKHTMSNYLTKTTSLFSRNRSSRKGKQGKAFETQPSLKEEAPSPAPPLRPPSPPKLRTPPPWVPPKEPFEPFCVADSIENIVMIPGSGEFVYDTEIQKKISKKRTESPQSINKNNDKNMSDAMLSLDQLKEDLPNIKWVSVVVNWFADSLNIRDCDIYPAVEFHDITVQPDDWQVEDIPRQHARLISRDVYGNPKYGGTVSDSALKRYLNELHRRGYKVMLYPMLVLETEEKQWRGKMTGPPNFIPRFFEHKYNRFIRHYAFIAKQTNTEAIIIGSEFVGLTKIRDKTGSYPAVTELVELAKEVKRITEGEVIVTYAADWTEYHISSSGWYPLDELWGSEFIDVVGINAYFPLTDETEPVGGYTVKDVILSWTIGEGYHYFYDYSQTSLNPIFYKDSKWAWKNIEQWWSELHFNPDGSGTYWQPKMKKIWFTEFGFPSVDACTNEPYAFVDGSKESKYPRKSNKKVSFYSQLVAIEGTLKKWQKSEMVEKMFLYAWDARPFPYFPMKRDVWGDCSNWEFGHWVQGKIGKIKGNKREAIVTGRRSLSLPKRTQYKSGRKYSRRLSADSTG